MWKVSLIPLIIRIIVCNLYYHNLFHMNKNSLNVHGILWMLTETILGMRYKDLSLTTENEIIIAI